MKNYLIGIGCGVLLAWFWEGYSRDGIEVEVVGAPVVWAGSDGGKNLVIFCGGGGTNVWRWKVYGNER